MQDHSKWRPCFIFSQLKRNLLSAHTLYYRIRPQASVALSTHLQCETFEEVFFKFSTFHCYNNTVLELSFPIGFTDAVKLAEKSGRVC